MNILITGGASGLGEAITKKCASEKQNRVFFTFCRSADRAQTLQKDFPNVQGWPCDFRSSSDIDQLLGRLPEIDLDVLVNNAIPGMVEKHFHKIAPEVFIENFRNYLLPTIRITQETIQIFRKKKSGRIINILSAVLEGTPPLGLSEYTASKAYLESLSRSWAVENAAFNITSNSISPGLMKTKLTQHKDERIFEAFVQQHPLKRLLTPEEVADSVYFLLQATPQINGINLLMNSTL